MNAIDPTAELRELIPIESYPFVASFDVIDSTSAYARRYYDGGGMFPALFVAKSQTAGVGRKGNLFFSPEGGLYLSLLLPQCRRAEDTVLVTSAVAVAVRRAIWEETGLSCGIKWVNDLYLRGRKVAGILAQAVPPSNGKEGALIIGVGVNILAQAFPAELTLAGSLFERDAHIPPNCHARLSASLAGHISRVLRAPSEPKLMEEYRQNSIVIGEEIVFYENGIAHRARAEGIDPYGGLAVLTDAGERRVLRSGEITLRMT